MSAKLTDIGMAFLANAESYIADAFAVDPPKIKVEIGLLSKEEMANYSGPLSPHAARMALLDEIRLMYPWAECVGTYQNANMQYEVWYVEGVPPPHFVAPSKPQVLVLSSV